jgi:hypothetical protein
MSFLENILYPLIRMIEVIASFCFIAIMILSFYKIITAGGDDAKIKTGKNAVFMAIVGFVLLKIPAALVSSIYGNAQCSANNILGICKIEDPKISNAIGIFTNIINFVNGFLGIVCVLGIIYA